MAKSRLKRTIICLASPIALALLLRLKMNFILAQFVNLAILSQTQTVSRFPLPFPPWLILAVVAVVAVVYIIATILSFFVTYAATHMFLSTAYRHQLRDLRAGQGRTRGQGSQAHKLEFVGPRPRLETKYIVCAIVLTAIVFSINPLILTALYLLAKIFPFSLLSVLGIFSIGALSITYTLVAASFIGKQKNDSEFQRVPSDWQNKTSNVSRNPIEPNIRVVVKAPKIKVEVSERPSSNLKDTSDNGEALSFHDTGSEENVPRKS